MQRYLATVSTVIAVALFAPLSEVKGQSSTKSVIAPPSRTINLTAEQRFMIKEIVLKDLNVAKAPAGAPESIGDPVPSSLELHDMTPTLAENAPQGQVAQILPHRTCDCACERQRPQSCGRNQN